MANGEEQKQEPLPSQDSKKKTTFGDKIAKPFAFSTKFVQAVAKRLNETVPFVYEQLDNLFSSVIIKLDEREKKKIEEGMGPGVFLDVLEKNLKKNIPSYMHIDDATASPRSLVRKIVDMLTKNKFRMAEISVLKSKARFKRMVIAASGQSALRILRACKEMGIKTILLYDKGEEKKSLAYRLADRTYKAARDAGTGLFRTKDIIEAAKKKRADAVHPGYGPLASSVKLAELCQANKLSFIGPRSETLRKIRNKIISKQIAESNRLLVVPGSRKVITTKQEVAEFAKLIGYPVLVKPVKGDLSIGIHQINEEKDVAPVFKRALIETYKKLHSKQFYLEKVMPEARNMEFVVIGDSYGTVVVLGSIDSTLSYGYRKLFQESPSPFLNDKLKEEMGNAVMDIAKAINFQGVGSVEFLLDKENKHYFLEFNPWVELDHELIEFLTGIDLVAEQIAIKAGSKLSFSQADIDAKVKETAVECRITNEDPYRDFKISHGSLKRYAAPGGSSVFVTSYAGEGQHLKKGERTILARLICKGPTRADALNTLNRALDEYVIEGIPTTLPLFKSIINTKEFLELQYDSDFFVKHKALLKK